MNMNNKEQLLYFFLQGKVSLSQYDYKFMANLQIMIQTKNRVTSNQAALFDNLISKYKKQLSKLGFIKEELKALPWKTLLVESTSEYTGAKVSLVDDDITIRVPFNKPFISAFRNVANNTFDWDKDSKLYKDKFSTTALKIAYTELPKYFDTMKFDEDLQDIIDDIKKFEAPVYNPTLTLVNGRLIVGAVNGVIGERLQDIKLDISPKTMFKMSQLGITVDPVVYDQNKKLEFAASRIYEAEITDVETVIGWMRNLGCENVVIGRGLRTVLSQSGLEDIISKYGMRPLGPMSFGKLPDGISMLIQHTSNIDVRNAFSGMLSKTVVIKDSRPIEVK